MKFINSLEKIIGKERREKLVKNRAYTWVSDIAAINLFSLSFALNEAFIAGMDLEEVVKTRLAAVVGNTIVGRPYGIYRDWVMKKLDVTENSSRLKKYITDIGTFATGATPFYLVFLAVAGAEPDEMVKAATFLTLAAPLVGRPQGWVYDKMRGQFGLETAYEKSERMASLAKRLKD
ncbi:MAG: L-alanine exporter AlaE [Nanoarchaeota archaeon]|nr:L-alanine exporter AlaE [Nanoarchaeota archaeon]